VMLLRNNARNHRAFCSREQYYPTRGRIEFVLTLPRLRLKREAMFNSLGAGF